jgi:hypothetical protein
LEPVPAKAGKVDPLVCPKCQGTMQVISFIEDPSVIRDILKHLGISFFIYPRREKAMPCQFPA